MPDQMNDPDELPDVNIDDYSAEDLNNKRKAVRYIRDDITAILFKKSLFETSQILVKLLDISSKGASITCSNKLPVNKIVSLRLIFADGRKFNLEATVIHKQGSPENKYGLKFDKFNNKLGEYILSSQSNLVFK